MISAAQCSIKLRLVTNHPKDKGWNSASSLWGRNYLPPVIAQRGYLVSHSPFSLESFRYDLSVLTHWCCCLHVSNWGLESQSLKRISQAQDPAPLALITVFLLKVHPLTGREKKKKKTSLTDNNSLAFKKSVLERHWKA